MGRFLDRPGFRGGWTLILTLGGGAAAGSEGGICTIFVGFCFLLKEEATETNIQMAAITAKGIHPASASEMERAERFIFSSPVSRQLTIDSDTNQLLCPSAGRATASRMAVSACTLRRR